MEEKIQLTFSLLILIAVKDAFTLEEGIRVTELYHITPYSQSKYHSSDVVEIPARQCGGYGRVMKVLHERCAAEIQDLGIILASNPGQLQLYFIPSRNTKGVTLRTTISADGELVQYENSLPDVNLEAGEQYVVIMVGTAVNELKGRLFIGQLEIIRESDKQTDVCLQADFFAF